MAKRLFIVHGWEGTPDSDWLPWLKAEMEKEGMRVFVPNMPDTAAPKMESWINRLSDCVGTADEDTYFVGHSIGAQTILRYLESLGAVEKVGGVILVAGWMNLMPPAFADDSDKDIARPWIETQIKWELVKSHASNFTAIFSDDDPYVPLSDANIFKEKLGAKIIVERGKGHFNAESGVMRLQRVKDELLLMSR